MNSVLPDKLSKNDVVRAHRIGRKEENKIRRLIARLYRSGDKMVILGRCLDFREKGFGAGNDLTRQQGDLVDGAREEGKIGFFKGGRFYTKPRPKPQDPPRPNTRSKSRQQQQQPQQNSGE